MAGWYKWTNEPCPKCKKGKKVICNWNTGKFYGCSKFPDCTYKENIKWNIDFEELTKNKQ